MALFPIIADLPEQAYQSAVDGAIDCLERLEQLNKVRIKEGKEGRTGDIGLHAGSVSYREYWHPVSTRFYGVGSTVNIASRIESLCKAHQAFFLASESVAKNCGRPLHRLGLFELDGHSDMIELYGLPPEVNLKPVAHPASSHLF